jgi:serine/threonine-protein kinase RsbW
MPEPLMLASEHVLRFSATLAGHADAAASLRQLLDTRQLEDGPRYNVELAFDEITANIIRHGSPTGEIKVQLEFREDEIVLTFEDDGVPFDPREQPTPPVATSIENAPIGGLGLVLVRKISTRMDYERTADERNHLTLAIAAR